MKANLYDAIITLFDVSTNFGKRIIPKGTQRTIVECYENPDGYAVDLAIPDDKLVGGFDYENVILTPEQFEFIISPATLYAWYQNKRNASEGKIAIAQSIPKTQVR